MSEYRLSAQLEGHEDDVRGVVFLDTLSVATASRDSTVRTWKQGADAPGKFEMAIASHGSGFKNSITFVKPTSKYPEGLIIAGGQDSIIEVRKPGSTPDDNAEALLLGHGHNVCSLDVEQSSGYVVSGGWDAQARIWRIGKWETEAVLKGHEGSVWAVLAWDSDRFITGCADTKIRIFSTTGKLIKTISGCQAVVRALCHVPKNHPSGAQFASASNDGIIRFWTLEGKSLGQIQAHDVFIYSLASLPSGELVSAAEDRTIRIWKGFDCVQTITHPAISVWSVAVSADNGDIISGASDRIARVFSRDSGRFASPEALKAFDDSVKSSSIPQQQVGDVNKEKLPGPEFLVQKSGTKEGQVVMIKESNGNVTAHQWSVATQQWINVGTVVDAAGSTGKKTEYLGQDFDYVFDVDIAEGQPPLKLPYNLSQNPYEAATKFIQDNELPMTYLDQVANFITTNTQSATLGSTEGQGSSGQDPWGMESRYRPGEASSQQSNTFSSSRPKVLPQTSYLSISQANLKPIQKKILDVNEGFVQKRDKDRALNPSDIASLDKFIQLYQKSETSKAELQQLSTGLPFILRLAVEWPAADRLPGLDLLRLITYKWPIVASFQTPSGQSVVELLQGSGIFGDEERPNNIMLALRTLANLFESPEGRKLADDKFQNIYEIGSTLTGPTPNRNLTIALTTLLINYSVLYTSSDLKNLPASANNAISLLQPITEVLQNAKDSEAIYRALVAVGTLLTLGEEVKEAAKSVYDLPSTAAKVGSTNKEPRIRGVIEEIRQVLAR